MWHTLPIDATYETKISPDAMVVTAAFESQVPEAMVAGDAATTARTTPTRLNGSPASNLAVFATTCFTT